MLEGQKSGRTLSRDRSTGRQHFFFKTLFLPTRLLPFLPLFINLVNPCAPPRFPLRNSPPQPTQPAQPNQPTQPGWPLQSSCCPTPPSGWPQSAPAPLQSVSCSQGPAPHISRPGAVVARPLSQPGQEPAHLFSMPTTTVVQPQ